MRTYEKNSQFAVYFKSESEALLCYGLCVAIVHISHEIIRDNDGKPYCHGSENALISMMVQSGHESFGVVRIMDPQQAEHERVLN